MKEFEAFRERALRGERLSGIWLSLGLGSAAEMAALSGYDWALIDREHGGGDDRETLAQLWALQAGITAAIVRVSGLVPEEVKRILDLAPAGVMIPDIQTPEQAAAAVRITRVPPQGTRGTATTTRSASYGYLRDRDRSREALLLVQIESVTAVENVHAIAATEGVDGLFAGPHDLSVSLLATTGSTSDLDESLARIAAAARAAGKVAGIVAGTPEDVARRAAMGYTLISCGSDRGILAAGLRSNAERVRSMFEGQARSVAGEPDGR